MNKQKKFHHFPHTLHPSILLSLFFLILFSLICIIGIYTIHSVKTPSVFWFVGTILILAIILEVCIFFLVIKPLCRSEKLIINNWIEHEQDDYTQIPPSHLDKMLELIFEKQQNSLHKDLTLKYLSKDAELHALQSQINPHFLYNTLECICGFAMMHDIPQIADLLERLASLFRNMTKPSNKLISVQDELCNIENYIVIQKFRFSDKFDYRIHIDNFAEVSECKIPNLILQPIIENSISHGFDSISSNGRIDLYITATQSRLLIRIVDNGSGIPQERLAEIINNLYDSNYTALSSTRHSGVALVNIHRRIQLQFGNLYGVHLSSTVNNGTEVSLTLPLIW